MNVWTKVGDVVEEYRYRGVVRRRLREMHRRAVRVDALRETRQARWNGHDPRTCEYCRPVPRSDKGY